MPCPLCLLLILPSAIAVRDDLKLTKLTNGSERVEYKFVHDGIADSSLPCGSRPGTNLPGLAFIQDTGGESASFLEGQEEDKYRCAALQDVCKTGDWKDANTALNKLYEDAEAWNPLFSKWLHILGDRFNAVARPAPLKGKTRAMEKIALKYTFGRNDQSTALYGARELTDIVRGSLVFHNESDMCDAVASLERHDAPVSNVIPGFNFIVVKSKNRFKKPADGYSDMMINLRLTHDNDRTGHVVELQLHHNLMEQAKKKFHCVYKFLRTVTEELPPEGTKGQGISGFKMMSMPFRIEKYLEPLREAATKYPDKIQELQEQVPGFDHRFNFNQTTLCGGRVKLNCDGGLKDQYKLEATYHALKKAMEAAYLTVQQSPDFYVANCIKIQPLHNIPAVPVHPGGPRPYAQESCKA
mmetsp:Transcript_44656/g.88445  ORF Transcript_44656/g.88445 Transcript_44656/m.88445 type:complete len:412 (+) Transcript_44656:64-1299(+)